MQNQSQTEKDVAKGASLDLRDQERREHAAAARPSRASHREWIGLAIIALPCMLYSMDFTVLHLAAPLFNQAVPSSSGSSICMAFCWPGR